MFSGAIIFLLVFSTIRNFFSTTAINAINAINWKNEFDEPDEIDWRKHPCKRTCIDGGPPMDCKYTFKFESYYAMSKACYDCPFNITDCFRPHCIPADGVKRSIQVVNRQMPGPSIEVCEGDKLTVDVTNLLVAESTSLHWHGQHNRGSPYMDGVPYVTQCPVLPGATFRYKFVAATDGTHFWHSHIGLQRFDGVFGALIVRLPTTRDPHRNLYDHDEHKIIIQDWTHDTGTEIYLAHYHGNNSFGPQNLLINGFGRYKRVKNPNGATERMPVATFFVGQGSRHRFRLINTSNMNCPIEISIDNHTLHVVSTDGNDIRPVEAGSLISYTGERFDFIVNMNQKIDNYWIRFRGFMQCGEKQFKAHQAAILRYRGAEETNPNGTVSYERVPMNKNALQMNAVNRGVEDNSTICMSLLRSIEPKDKSITRDPDVQFYISYDYYKKEHPEFHRRKYYEYNQVHDDDSRIFTPQINLITMILPSFPLLSQRESIGFDEFCNASSVNGCRDKFCACTHVLRVKLGSVVELVLIDEGMYDSNHAFHLHGHSFRVVAMARVDERVTAEEVRRLDAKGLVKRNLDNPPIKDTVTVPDGGYTIVRFHANNPGYWLFHCHIEFHAMLGMSLIFKVGEHEEFEPVPRGFPQCGNWKP